MRIKARTRPTMYIAVPMLAGALVCAGLVLIANTAAAQPPLGEPDTCEQAGVTGALHGLCNAYCEALDCDGESPNGTPTACAAVERNYVRKSGGAPPPCLAPECPCFSTDEVAALAVALGDTATYENLRCRDRSPGKPITALAAQRIDGAPCSPESQDCSALSIAFTEDNACELNTPSESRQIGQITEAQRVACRDAILIGAAAGGLACN